MERTTLLLILFVAAASSKPIMVTFGTSQGPIVPREKPSPPVQPRQLLPHQNPAPVSEEAEDVPNPSTYRPLVPHQYRTKLYSYKPPPNLVLGTPVDQRYTPGLDNTNYNDQRFSSIGVGYTGPHIFEKQAYEFEAKKLKLQPSVRYDKPYQPQDYSRQQGSQQQAYNQQQDNQQQSYQSQKYVPQIGIVYSSGVKYYVPQFVYYSAPRQDLREEDRENSVYDKDDRKYNYQGRQQ